MADDFSFAAYDWALASWLETRQKEGGGYRPSTVALYTEMWSSFVAWCGGQSPAVPITAVSKKVLEAFQQSRQGLKQEAISPLHSLRLLRLIDKVLKHMAPSGSGGANTAAFEAIKAKPEIRYAASSSAEPQLQSLDGAQTKQLMRHLSGARPRLGREDAALTWHHLRNQVAVSLQLGAGLGPAELRFLTLGSVVASGGRIKDRPWMLRVPAIGGAPAHDAPMALWAAQLLQHWLQVRAGEGIEGQWLFPSTRSGKQWGKVAQYNAAKQVFQEAGLEDVAGGSFVLRHTFALRQLRRGTKPEEVGKWMGVKDPKVMARYARVLQGPTEVV